MHDSKRSVVLLNARAEEIVGRWAWWSASNQSRSADTGCGFHLQDMQVFQQLGSLVFNGAIPHVCINA